MADYTPVFLPGLTMTSQAAGAITGGDPVEVAGSGTVQKCTAGPGGVGSFRYVGLAAHDAAVGKPVTVILDRVVHEGPADGPITYGDQLMASTAAGRQVTRVPDTAGTPGKADVDQARCVIGIALISASDGGTVRWMQR